MPFNKAPSIQIKGNHNCLVNWEQIGSELLRYVESSTSSVIVIECYQGILIDEIVEGLSSSISFNEIINAGIAMKSTEEIENLTYPDVTDDRVFGYLSRLRIDDFFNEHKRREQIAVISALSGVNLII